MNQTAQKRIQSLLESLVKEGRERGLQVSAYIDGKLVVNAAAGWMEREQTKRVEPGTLFPVFSCTKGIASTLVHVLAERGQLDYDTRVADLWPEFAANGKDRHLVRHLLAHMAGLQHMPTGIGMKEMLDWDTMCQLMAAAKPVSGPGEKMNYHPVTHGWLVGEVAHRADGRSFQQLLEDEARQPLGLTDELFVGSPARVDDRVAILERLPDPDAPPAPPAAPEPVEVPRDIPLWMQPLSVWMNRIESRRAVVPASNGIMTAHALARFYASLLPGGVDGFELLPPARMKAAAQRQFPTDQSEPLPRKGLGYGLGNPDGGDMPTRETAFGHGGYGGSIGYADPEYGMAVGLTKNLFSKGEAHGYILRELRDALGIPQ